MLLLVINHNDDHEITDISSGNHTVFIHHNSNLNDAYHIAVSIAQSQIHWNKNDGYDNFVMFGYFIQIDQSFVFSDFVWISLVFLFGLYSTDTNDWNFWIVASHWLSDSFQDLCSNRGLVTGNHFRVVISCFRFCVFFMKSFEVYLWCQSLFVIVYHNSNSW